MKNKRKIKLNLYVDRSGNIKVRKGNFRLEDGELRVGLTLYVPEKFFRPASLEAEASIIFKNEDLPPMELEVEK